jgi:hypothetical protein
MSLLARHREMPRRFAPARSVGAYFTDGARLLHVLPLGRGLGNVVAVEDCRTLEVRVASAAEVARLRLRRVALSAPDGP